MTIRWIYPNFDFEYELARPNAYQPSRFFADFAVRWGSVLRLLPGCAAAEPLPLDAPEQDASVRWSFAEDGEGIAWGITPRVLRLGSVLAGASYRERVPDQRAVATVNGKCFSQTIAEQLGIALPQSQIIRTSEAMEEAVRDCPFEWVLKHPFGVSGRERVLGKAHHLKDNARVWALRLLAAGVPLIFEPWIEKSREYSLHFEIARDGTIAFLGSCLLLTAQSGQHRGNRRVHGWEPPASALVDAWRTIRAVAAEGYYGPVSFDAMTGTLGDVAIERALVEINARYTFGRLTLEIGAHLPVGWSYTWWIPSQRESKKVEGRSFPPLSTGIAEAGAYRLPEAYDPAHASQGLVLAAPSEEELASLEAEWMV